VKILTDGIADFVWSSALAGFSGSSVIDSDHSEIPLAVLGEVRHCERVSCSGRRVDRRPVTGISTAFLHWTFLYLVSCGQTQRRVTSLHCSQLPCYHSRPTHTDVRVLWFAAFSVFSWSL